MKNAILKICEKLRGYSSDKEHFEVLKVITNGDGTYTVIVKPYVDDEGAKNESN